MRLCDALVGALIKLDVKHVFGVGGANIEHVHDAIHRLGGGKITAVLAKRECGAAYMADGYARTHQKLGVCCATSGGGMLNLLEGIAESYADAVPVLAIIGQSPQALEGNGAFQDSSGLRHTVNAEMMCLSMSKYTKKIVGAEEFWPSLTEAVISALTPPRGPSILLIPRNLYDQEVAEMPPMWLKSIEKCLVKKVPAAADLNLLRTAIESAKNPLLLLGSGTLWADRSDLREFVKNNGLAVATSMSARQSYPNDDSNYLGVVGVAGHPSVHKFICEQADLIIAAGTYFRFMTSSPIESALSDKRLIFIHEDSSSLPLKFIDREFIVTDIGKVFSGLKNGVRGTSSGRLETLKNYQRTYLAPQWSPPITTAKLPDQGAIAQLRQSSAILQLARYLPSPGHIFFDAGNCAAAAIHMLTIPTGSTSNIALGMGGMGYSIGGAIGAQLGADEQCHTLSIVGDGAFLMSGFEVHTAVEWQLPILFVIFNNAMHGMCVTREQLFFEGRIECSTFSRVNFEKVAQAFGDQSKIWTGRATTDEELSKCLASYFTSPNRPGVLDLIIDREETPPFSPFATKDAAVIVASALVNSGNQ